ncbi:MAG: DMT family transporter [Elusimicrobiota bacterium]|nr:MAG: DMT family transporter [Elusimicrobiota bacterium]
MIPLLYALVCLIWGSTWLAIKFGLEGVPPFLGAGLRFALAAAVLWALVLWSKVPWRLSPDGRRAAPVAGVLGFGICYALVYWAETRVSSGLVAVLHALVPLVVSVLTVFVVRTETMTARKGLGIAVGTSGVVLLFWPEKGVAAVDGWGLLAALIAGLGAGCNLVVQSLYSKKDDARALNAWGMSIGAALLLGLSLLFERGAAVTWTAANAGALLYLSIAGSVVAFLSYYRLIRLLPATQVSLITLIFPAVALVLGWLVLGETLGPKGVFGIALIMGGVGLALKKR